MWYVGLDWADTHHDMEVLDEAGKRVGAQRFAHSLEGLNQLKAFLLGIAAPEELACSVETVLLSDMVDKVRIGRSLRSFPPPKRSMRLSPHCAFQYST